MEKVPLKKKTGDHIIMSTIYSGEHVPSGVAGGELLCLHCGDRYMPTFPSPLGMMIAIQKEFGKEHRRCKKSPRGEALEKKHTEDWWHWNRRKRAKEKNGHVVIKGMHEGFFELRACTFGENGEMGTISDDIIVAGEDHRQFQERRGGRAERRPPLPEDSDQIVEVWY